MAPTRAGWALSALIAVAFALAACSNVVVPEGLGPPVIPPKQARSLGAAPVQGPGVRFALTTVTGIPGKFQIALEDSLKRFALTRQLILVPTGDPTTTYRAEGYISAVGDVNRVLLVYVWDIYDAQGNRVHRISGQEPASSGGVDPWTAVTMELIDNAARQTIDSLADWARA